jgi:hypothetical protein
MENKRYDVEVVIGNGTYKSDVDFNVLQMMFQADIVTVLGKSVRVAEIEATDEGVFRFHGNDAELDE